MGLEQRMAGRAVWVETAAPGGGGATVELSLKFGSAQLAQMSVRVLCAWPMPSVMV